MVSLKRLSRGDLRIEDRGPTAYVLSCFAHYGLRALFLSKTRRDVEAVHKEYNRGERHEYWKESLTPDEYIYDDGQRERWILLDDRLVRGTLRQVRERLLPRLKERVLHYSKPNDLIVEFGAGTGRNLAYLGREVPDRRYLGLELTPRSVEDARRMLAAAGVTVEMRVGDMTNPPKLDEKPALTFSIQALEQLPGAVSREALKQMAAYARNAVVCIEPIRELYTRDVRGLTSRLRQYRADYLVGLPTHAKSLGLNVVKLERIGLAENPLNEVCELLVELQ
jgi:SAM-dependent methyltransferase